VEAGSKCPYCRRSGRSEKGNIKSASQTKERGDLNRGIIGSGRSKTNSQKAERKNEEGVFALAPDAIGRAVPTYIPAQMG
jgi:hypothetical protein